MGSFRSRHARMNQSMRDGSISESRLSKAARLLNSNDAHAARSSRGTRLCDFQLIGLLVTGLFGCDAAGRFNEAFDSLLDVPERPEAGFDGRRGDILQNIGRDGVAQAVEIIDKLAAARREKQAVGPAISGIGPPLEKTVLDQTHQRDRLQLKHLGQIDLRQPFLLPQSKQHDPLRARGATALRAVIDIIAQQPRALDKLCNQLAFQIERHDLRRSSKAFQLLSFSQAIVCLHIKCTHIISGPLGTVLKACQLFLNRRAHMTKSRTIRWILPIAALAAAGYFVWQRWHGRDSVTQAENAQKSAASARRPPVPVTIAPVVKADFPVYLTGLGNVQGFNTVVVRTRVDGQIDKVAFKEGQLVNQGDLLVEIDPRPFQATLDQAKAKKAQDEANLANANLDLQRYTKLGEFATRQQTDTQRSTVAQLTAQIAADDAATFNAQTQLDYTAVKAPISGVAGLRQVDIGNIVNASTQTGIVTIAQI